MNSLLFTVCWMASLVIGLAQTPASTPLWRAHAHNDYLHTRPLADALAHGFRSVEADIWLTNGTLLVSHDFRDTSPEKTLEALYLDPLRAFVRTNAWRSRTPSLTLLIDVKSDAEKTYAVLREVLRRYSDMLTRFESNSIRTNAVTVIISGARAEAVMREEKIRFAALDGRLGDLNLNPPPALVPLVSDNWTKHFQWRGVGEMSGEEREKLHQFVSRTHAQGRRLRFWATPDNGAGWRELFEAGVDLLNTDKLADLERFLRTQESKRPQ
jgi:hypothetical protein